MSNSAPIKLSVLRDLGWKHWDPIGLSELDGGWQSSSAADEYDGYLMQVASRIRTGAPDEEIVAYLVEAESERMGMGENTTTRGRAEATVAAIKTYLSFDV
jgi:hypothetical protein